jgi:hypothetical protein
VGPFSRWKLLSGAAEWSTSSSPVTMVTTVRQRSWAPTAGSGFPWAGSIYVVWSWGAHRRLWHAVAPARGAHFLRPLAWIRTPHGRICDGWRRLRQWQRQRIPTVFGNDGGLPVEACARGCGYDASHPPTGGAASWWRDPAWHRGGAATVGSVVRCVTLRQRLPFL